MNETRLTCSERDDLTKYEASIERGAKTFVEVGSALLAIRDRRLYRAEFTSFEDYCLSKWSFTKTHANRLITAAEVVANLAPIGAVPATESQARPMAGLPPQTQREVWQAATDGARADGGRVTAARVKELVAKAAASVPPQTPAQPTREDVQESERQILDAGREDAYRDAVEAALRLADRLARRLADLRPADRRRVVARVTG